MTGGSKKVQILAIPPCVESVPPEDWNALFFPRISIGLLQLMESAISLMVVKNEQKFAQESRFLAILAKYRIRTPNRQSQMRHLKVGRLALTRLPVPLQSPHPMPDLQISFDARGPRAKLTEIPATGS